MTHSHCNELARLTFSSMSEEPKSVRDWTFRLLISVRCGFAVDVHVHVVVIYRCGDELLGLAGAYFLRKVRLKAD